MGAFVVLEPPERLFKQRTRRHAVVQPQVDRGKLLQRHGRVPVQLAEELRAPCDRPLVHGGRIAHAAQVLVQHAQTVNAVVAIGELTAELPLREFEGGEEVYLRVQGPVQVVEAFGDLPEHHELEVAVGVELWIFMEDVERLVPSIDGFGWGALFFAGICTVQQNGQLCPPLARFPVVDNASKNICCESAGDDYGAIGFITDEHPTGYAMPLDRKGIRFWTFLRCTGPVSTLSMSGFRCPSVGT